MVFVQEACALLSQVRYWTCIGRISVDHAARDALALHIANDLQRNCELLPFKIEAGCEIQTKLEIMTKQSHFQKLMVDPHLLFALIECTACCLSSGRGVKTPENARRLFQLDTDVLLQVTKIFLEILSLGILEDASLTVAEKRVWDYVQRQLEMT